MEIFNSDKNPDYFSTNWYNPGFLIAILGALLHTLMIFCTVLACIQKY